MKLVAFALGCLISAPLCAVEKDGLTITITAEEDEACSNDGPCLVIPLGVVQREIQRRELNAAAQALVACRNRL